MTRSALFRNALIVVAICGAPSPLFAADHEFLVPDPPTSVSEAPQVSPASVVATTPSGAPTGVNEPSVPVSAPERVVSHWYGWQTLTVDGVALSCVFGGAALGTAPLAAMGGTTYVLGGPVVHMRHGHWGAAGGSLALRVGLPVAFALIGHGVEPCGPDENADTCGLRGPALGALVGIGAAVVIDSAVLAREDLPVSPERSHAQGLSPVIAIDTKRAFLGVGGEF